MCDIFYGTNVYFGRGDFPRDLCMKAMHNMNQLYAIRISLYYTQNIFDNMQAKLV